jgi:electron transfer flavoprotein alpha subunit
MAGGDIWVYGDWRNYHQNRVSLQLLAKARELAAAGGGRVCAVVFGHGVAEWVAEYQAHGAQRVYVLDDARLTDYLPGVHARLLEGLARERRPEIILVGATAFGQELAARAASRLGTGLTADCVDLELDGRGVLVQTAPAYGGSLLADIVMPRHRPQMATVRPGVFAELDHDESARAEIVRLDPPPAIPGDGVRVKAVERQPYRGRQLEKARVVVCGGRGLGSRERFAELHELARLLGGEVGATRPVVYAGWATEEALVGQAGRQIAPRLLLSFGISGAIQHTAGIDQPDFTVAVNTNPRAMMMAQADAGIAADASQVCRELVRRLRGREAGSGPEPAGAPD